MNYREAIEFRTTMLSFVSLFTAAVVVLGPTLSVQAHDGNEHVQSEESSSGIFDARVPTKAQIDKSRPESAPQSATLQAPRNGPSLDYLNGSAAYNSSAWGNPWNCKGTTHNPHPSKHSWLQGLNEIHVEAATFNCSQNMLRVYAQVDLYRVWSWLPDDKLHDGPLYSKSHAKSVNAHSWKECDSDQRFNEMDYKGKGFHRVVDYYGGEYFAYTSKTVYDVICQSGHS